VGTALGCAGRCTNSASYAPSGAIQWRAERHETGEPAAAGTSGQWPDWLEVDFAGGQTINEIDVFSLQDNYQTHTAPTGPRAKPALRMLARAATGWWFFFALYCLMRALTAAAVNANI
jgi:hypothetical protein